MTIRRIKLFGREKAALMLLLCLIGIGYSEINAQETTVYSSSYRPFNTAMELFDKEKYVAAQRHFDEIIDKFSGERSEIAITARYYSALCAIELFNTNAENLLINFIRDYPENPKTRIAHFQLGKYWFRKRRYRSAIEWFEKVSIYDLDNNEVAEYYFKLGYAYFMEEKNESALKAFYEIKDTDTRFTATARYYYAHLSYLDKKYETALKDFQKIEKHPKFSGIVPYYIAQIYYLQKKYDSLLSYAPPLLDSASTKRRPEIARLIGEAYYNKGQFKESVPFLTQYAENHSISRLDAYELGYANYKSEQYDEGIRWFKQAILSEDSLSQVSYYHIAECYLKSGDKQNARNTLSKAAGMKFDDEIRENAMFNFAKLAYELSYHPYNDAIRAFESYMNEYPNSQRLPQAQEYLIGVYYTTKNYKEALRSLDRIKNRSYKLEQAYQKVAYLRGIELFKERNFEKAIAHFDLSLTKDFDVNIRLSSLYWKAEAWYRIYKFDKAIPAYQAYLNSAAAITHPQYALAYYGEGYANYRRKQYKEAITSLRNYVRIEKKDDNRKNDALLRIGDCYFINKQYEEAIEYYDKATLMGLVDPDYALFQSGISNKILKNNSEKTSLWLTLVESYPNSTYRDDAIYELGESYMDVDNEKAISYFDKLIEEYTQSIYQSIAHLKKGLVFYNREEDDKALASLKVVVTDYRETPEAVQAIKIIQRIYTDRGDLAGFQSFLAASPEIEITKSSLDSAQYEIAENNYMSGNCDDAVKNFTSYLNNDSIGIFEINARFYRAECESQSGFMNEALIDYEFILEKPKNKFSESALIQAAKINYELDKYDRAAELYEELAKSAEDQQAASLSNLYLSRIYFKKELYDKTIEYGEVALKEIKLAPHVQEEVQLMVAKSYQSKDDFNKAYELLAKLAENNTEAGAEAKYITATIEFLRGNYDACEERILEVVNQVPSFDYWIAKAFILLSDKYFATDDLFQARYTLESVLDNYKGEELTKVAEAKLELIKDAEERDKLEREKPEEEIIIQESEENYDYLFEEEVIDEE